MWLDTNVILFGLERRSGSTHPPPIQYAPTRVWEGPGFLKMQGVPFYSNSRCKSVRFEHFLAKPRGDPFRGTVGHLKIDLRIDLNTNNWRSAVLLECVLPLITGPGSLELERFRKQSTTRKWPYRRFWPQILTEILTPNFDPGSAGEDLKEGGVFIGTKDRKVEE